MMKPTDSGEPDDLAFQRRGEGIGSSSCVFRTADTSH
jgi:hypothetical protein